ncbi:MAG: GNAT superfamily N-acetyltransferase [Myxococcota bacterium]
MQPFTLGFRTDLTLVALDGEVERYNGDGDGYWLARSRSRPKHAWTNFLLFDRTPTANDVAPWTAILRTRFADMPELAFEALGWDVDHLALAERDALQVDAAVAAFVTHGFKSLDVTSFQTAQPMAPANADRTVVVRPLETDADWVAQHTVDCAARSEVTSRPDFQAALLETTMRYRRLAEAGRGQFFGAFEAGELLGSLGLYYDPATRLGRYQRVIVAPTARRRGICARLIADGATQFRARFGVERFVISAHTAGPARRVYQACGFVETHQERGVYRAKD